jgi:hypothetical protein
LAISADLGFLLVSCADLTQTSLACALTQNLSCAGGWAASAGAVAVTRGKIVLSTVGADRNKSKNLFIN